MVSVSTVTDTRVDPSKEEGLDGWRNHFDGTAEWSSPHWADQFHYKRFLGTLAHFTITSSLDSSVERDPNDEDVAAKRLKHWWAYAPTNYVGRPSEDLMDKEALSDVEDRIDNDEIWVSSHVKEPLFTYYDVKREGGHYDARAATLEAHSIDEDTLDKWIEGTSNTYDGEDVWVRAMSDVNHIKSMWEDAREQLPIEKVLDCEKYVIDQEWGYAGQFDFLYEDENGDTVLADFKTGSAIRLDYKIQLAGYQNALDEEIDRLQVIRLHPSDDTAEIEDNTDWDRTIDGLTAEFCALTERTHTNRLADYQ